MMHEFSLDLRAARRHSGLRPLDYPSIAVTATEIIMIVIALLDVVETRLPEFQRAHLSEKNSKATSHRMKLKADKQKRLDFFHLT